MNENLEKYKDIINLPHPVSKSHPQMSMHDRAAQFAPFAALVGYKEEAEEVARTNEVDHESEYMEDQLNELDEKFQHILDHPGEEVTLTIYFPDARKEGGRFQDITGVVKRFDVDNRVLIFEDGNRIGISRITDITY